MIQNILLSCTVFTLLAFSNSYAAKTLCIPPERVLFSCTTEASIISLCNQTNKVIYRSNEKDASEIELTPSEQQRIFFSTGPLGGGDTAQLRIKNKNIEYLIFTYSEIYRDKDHRVSRFYDSSGQFAVKHGEIIKQSICTNDAHFDSLTYEIFSVGDSSEEFEDNIIRLAKPISEKQFEN